MPLFCSANLIACNFLTRLIRLDSLDWQCVEMRPIYLQSCKHRHRHLTDSTPAGSQPSPPLEQPKMAPDGAFEGVYLVIRSVPTSITHIHSNPMSPTYTTAKSIELIVQTGSRESTFTAQNASNSAECRKMRFSANIFSVTRPRPGFNHFKRLVW